MLVLGGRLKFKERLSARLGDVLSQLYIASSVLKYFLQGPRQPEDEAHMRWALDHCLFEIARAFDEFLRNFPVAWARWVMRAVVFPLGNHHAPVSDALNAKVADLLRKRLEATPLPKKGRDDFITRYRRRNLVNAIIDALTRAGREDEVFPLQVAEVPRTQDYDEFVRTLIHENRIDEAKELLNSCL